MEEKVTHLILLLCVCPLRPDLRSLFIGSNILSKDSNEPRFFTRHPKVGGVVLVVMLLRSIFFSTIACTPLHLVSVSGYLAHRLAQSGRGV